MRAYRRVISRVWVRLAALGMSPVCERALFRLRIRDAPSANHT